VLRVSQAGVFGSGCHFYRNEGVPHNARSAGPPYSLLQGTLSILLDTSLPVESYGTILRGDVATIGNDGNQGSFFIAQDPHTDWASSFSVWGYVKGETGMSVVMNLTNRAYREQIHTSGTVMRMLVHPVPFSVQLL